MGLPNPESCKPTSKCRASSQISLVGYHSQQKHRGLHRHNDHRHNLSTHQEESASCSPISFVWRACTILLSNVQVAIKKSWWVTQKCRRIVEVAHFCRLSLDNELHNNDIVCGSYGTEFESVHCLQQDFSKYDSSYNTGMAWHTESAHLRVFPPA